MKKNKGFTLIELLAVLAILSILIIVSIPSILDLLDKSKQNAKDKAVNLVVSAGKLYASDYKIGLSQPITISTLCSKNYLKCPVTDPMTETTMNGYIYSSIDKSNNNTIKYNYVEGTPTKLLDTIIATVGTKNIDTNKYAGNGLYKWGSKYIYRGGITKTNTNGLTTTDYLTDTDSGSEVSNYIKVPWETYTEGENCTSSTNKCYRIISINEDSSITIVRDKSLANQVFDNTHNTAASNYYSQPSIHYGYNDLLENIPTSGHPEEYRQYSNMYAYLYGSNGYENTTIKPYLSILQPLDVCLNKVNDYAGINNSSYATTTRVTDTCNISGKSNTTAVNTLRNKHVRLPYTEEYLNATTESTCTQSDQYQCRNQNYLYNKISYFSFNGCSSSSWLVRSMYANGLTNYSLAYGSFGVRPVVILKKDVIITSGTGTQTNPYTIAN